jgi:predicted PurR-regulated permease PerM
MGGPLLRDLEIASNTLASSYETIKSTWPETGTLFQRTVAEQLPPPQDLYDALAGERGAETAQAILGVTANIFSFFGNLGIILILSLYWNADSARFERLWLSIISVEKRSQARVVWRSIERGVGAYIRSEVFQSFLAGLLLWLGYRMLGLNYPVLLALFGALAWLIPWLGAILAVIPPLWVGLAISLPLGAAAGIYTLLVLLFQELVIEPRFFPRQNYSSVILVLVILALSDVFGLIGLILAPLLAAAIQITFRFLAQPPVAATPVQLDYGETVREIVALQERVANAKAMLASKEITPSPEVVSLVERLDRLILETNRYLTNGSKSGQ